MSLVLRHGPRWRLLQQHQVSDTLPRAPGLALINLQRLHLPLSPDDSTHNTTTGWKPNDLGKRGAWNMTRGSVAGRAIGPILDLQAKTCWNPVIVCIRLFSLWLASLFTIVRVLCLNLCLTLYLIRCCSPVVLSGGIG